MPNPPKTHQGKQVKLSQVTAKTTISGYVDLPLIFNTDQGPEYLILIRDQYKQMWKLILLKECLPL